MTTIEEISDSQKTLESLLAQKMADFEHQLKSSSSKQPDNLAQLTKDYLAFKEFMCSSVDLLKRLIAALNISVDNIEMRHRKKYLIFNGIPENKNENTSDIIINICQKHLDMSEFTNASLQYSHRLGVTKTGHSRPILVKFADMSHKISVWHKKSRLKGSSIVLSEFLTRRRQSLFLEARKHFGMKNVWTLDGNIIVKLPSGSRQRMSSSDDLNKLILENPVLPNETTSRDATDKTTLLKRTEKVDTKTKRATRHK